MRQTREEEQAYWDAKIASASDDIDRMLNPDIQDSVIDHYQLAVVILDRTQRHAEHALSRFATPAPAIVEEAPEPVVEPEPEPAVDLAAENEALRARIAELETIPEPTPEPEPETHFADLMLAYETIDDARARLSQRLRELRHYLIAPEIKVNEDGSVGLTAGEQAELQDLERRQTLGRWLEA